MVAPAPVLSLSLGRLGHARVLAQVVVALVAVEQVVEALAHLGQSCRRGKLL